MAANRDAAAGLGLPAAVHANPGWQKHLFPGKSKPASNLAQTTNRSSQRGMRMSRRARAA